MATRRKLKELAVDRVTQIEALPKREVIRCDHCKLVQFRSASDLCRRCKEELPLERKGTLFLVARAFSFNLDVVESGLPLDALNRFAEESALTLAEIYDVVIAARTLKHRRSREESLSRDESDKLARLMRVHDQAVRIFGEAERALWWLREPEPIFEGRTPLQMTRTEFGGRLVEEALVQIDEGMFV